MTTTQPIHPSRTAHRHLGTTIAVLIVIGVAGFAAPPRSAADGPPVATTPASPTLVTSTTARSRTAYLIIQDEIDRARRTRSDASTTPILTATATDDGRRRGFATVLPSPDVARPAYLIIQDEIDRALAERDRVANAGG